MTSGSLGLRTGSYGSLQQQLQNSVLLPIQTSPIIVRKPSKMLVAGSREKERCVPRICKFAGRRRVGMLLVVAISVLVFMSVLSVITKDEDVPEVVGHTHMHNIRPNNSLPYIDPGDPMINGSHENKTDNNSGSHENKIDNNSSLQNNVSMSAVSEAQLPPPSVFLRNALPFHHPCEKFALPPPPNDRKRTGPRPCPVCYLPVAQAIALMPKESSTSPVLSNLTYVYEENSIRTETFGGSEFGGYRSLKQRNDSFDIKKSMNVHCGFVKGRKPGHQTGFDIDDLDLLEMEQCRGIVVASAIFGNYDIIQQPKNISEASKKSVCFYMFIDEETEAYMRNSSVLDGGNKVGLWRVVVVRNLPYLDARRNGKVPKLLLHRIFPNARFSIWIDGKLELVVDPYQILERFLWRKNATFAISRHYRRFDVFDEAEANKAAGKYDNASIDYQVEFYKQEGLTPYTEAKLPITSDVPEGCVIIKEHIPITNLFTCLWFNEVDHFTSRDQISFSTTRDKIMSKVNWSINMFLDCERRNFVVQAYHRDLLEHMAPPVSIVVHPPPALLPEVPNDRITRSTPKKMPTKRSRERKSSSRRHRKVAIGSRENNSF